MDLDACRDPWGCDGWCRCTPNPYRFTVKVEQSIFGNWLICIEGSNP